MLGRLPIRVELKPLSRDDLKKILIEPKYNLISQQKELLKRENINLTFSLDAIDEIATSYWSKLCLINYYIVAEDFNLSMENLGARRLHSLIEKIVEDVSFEGPDLENKEYVMDIKHWLNFMNRIQITAEYVKDKLKSLKDKTDLTRYLI